MGCVFAIVDGVRGSLTERLPGPDFVVVFGNFNTVSDLPLEEIFDFMAKVTYMFKVN